MQSKNTIPTLKLLFHVPRSHTKIKKEWKGTIFKFNNGRKVKLIKRVTFSVVTIVATSYVSEKLKLLKKRYH